MGKVKGQSNKWNKKQSDKIMELASAGHLTRDKIAPGTMRYVHGLIQKFPELFGLQALGDMEPRSIKRNVVEAFDRWEKEEEEEADDFFDAFQTEAEEEFDNAAYHEKLAKVELDVKTEQTTKFKPMFDNYMDGVKQANQNVSTALGISNDIVGVLQVAQQGLTSVYDQETQAKLEYRKAEVTKEFALDKVKKERMRTPGKTPRKTPAKKSPEQVANDYVPSPNGYVPSPMVDDDEKGAEEEKVIQEEASPNRPKSLFATDTTTTTTETPVLKKENSQRLRKVVSALKKLSPTTKKEKKAVSLALPTPPPVPKRRFSERLRGLTPKK